MLQSYCIPTLIRVPQLLRNLFPERYFRILKLWDSNRAEFTGNNRRENQQFSGVCAATSVVISTHAKIVILDHFTQFGFETKNT